jgi:cellulose synthase/poly-beta-1,6-N-acetylglucosamine synthase-like glycosyltransferase
LIGRGPVQARGLIGNNMALRRSVLARYLFEEALRYGCDEDELAWRLQSDGYRIGFVPDAIVHHDHPMTLRDYLRVGYKQGQGSARCWYKQGRYIGRDLVPITLALVTLPLGFLDLWLLLVPVFFLLAQLAALIYNQYVLKGKSLATAVKVLPIEIAYYAAKTASVYLTLLRILLGDESEIRRSKRAWWRRPHSPPSGQEPPGERR